MSDVDPLVKFIRDRLDEDERAALATTPVPVAGVWKAARDKHAKDGDPLRLVQGDEVEEPGYEGYSTGHPIIVFSADWQDEAEMNLRHVALHDPHRVLRGVEAKRLLLEGHEPERGVVSWDSNGAPVYGQVCAACGTDDNPEVWPCRHTRLLAFEWSPHEVYLANREKWKP